MEPAQAFETRGKPSAFETRAKAGAFETRHSFLLHAIRGSWEKRELRNLKTRLLRSWGRWAGRGSSDGFVSLDEPEKGVNNLERRLKHASLDLAVGLRLQHGVLLCLIKRRRSLFAQMSLRLL